MIKFLQTKILHFIHNKRAVSLIMFAGFAMVGVTVALTTVNINDNNKVKAALQSLADQSLLSAQTIKDKVARLPICKDFFDKGVANNPFLKDKVIVNRSACSMLSTTYDQTGFKADVTILSTLGGTFGVGRQTLQIEAKTSTENRKIEFIYALSTQGTMCAKVTKNSTGISVVKDDVCTKFEVVKFAVQDSITQLSKTFVDFQLKIGVVPYNYKVKFPDLSRIPGSLTALESETNFFTQFTNEEPLAEIMPLTNNYTDIKNKVAAMTLTPEAISWGRSDIGIHTAALMLDPSQKQFFSNHPVNDWLVQDDNMYINSTENQKYIVLLGDALNMGCCFTNNPSGNYNNQYLYNYTPYNDHMLSVCNALKAKQVTIFTILLNSDGVPDNVGEMADNLMARCASGKYQNPIFEINPNNKLKCNLKTNCYNVSTNLETIAAFKNITERVLKPTIAE